MAFLGLELNATCARAVHGERGEFPLPCPLDPPALDLPLVLNLAQDPPQIGRAAVMLLRRLPHVCCHRFLPFVGERERRWGGNSRRLDSADAMGLVWLYLRASCGQTDGIVLTLPGYLTRVQGETIRSLAEHVGFSVLGCVPSHLAAALSGYAQQAWFGSTIVLDIDDYALTIALVRAADGQAHVHEGKFFPHLGLHAWKEHMLNALADCCVRQSRRDPRESPLAEQTLYEHLDGLFEAALRGRMVNVGLQSNHWYQNLVVQPEHTLSICSGMVRCVVAEVEALWKGAKHELEPRSLLLTDSVARLPGLAAALRECVDGWAHHSRHYQQANGHASEEDFGEDLMAHGGFEKSTVVVLPADAGARGAHALAVSFQQGELRGFIERMAPLPLPLAADAGPPRLHFQGRDFPLSDHCFVLGCMAACDMVFDSTQHPTVGPRHCEIVLDHRTFLLFDRSGEGTWVNDVPVSGSIVLKPGDCIRLGREGPCLRFLGQAAHRVPTRVTV